MSRFVRQYLGQFKDTWIDVVYAILQQSHVSSCLAFIWDYVFICITTVLLFFMVISSPGTPIYSRGNLC